MATTNYNQIPQNRMNEIARRKLLALGVQTRLAADRETLQGEITIPPQAALKNQLTSSPILKIEFEVHGYDHLIVLTPAALSGMAPIKFYDHERLQTLLTQFGVLLDQRVSALQRFSSRLRQLGIENIIDRDNARVVAQLQLPNIGKVVLHANERGMAAVELHPLHASGQAQPLAIPLNLEELTHKMDIELFLGHQIESSGKQKAAASPLPGVPAAVSAVMGPSMDFSSEGVTLGLLVSALGKDGLLNPGFSVALSVPTQGAPVQILAQHEQGDLFSASVSGSEGLMWSGHFQLSTFPGVAGFLSRTLPSLVLPAQPGSPGSLGNAPSGHPPVGTPYQLPAVGQIWTMNLLVEEETEQEIRYVPMDIDGRPFGAPRVLPRDTFLGTFSKVGGGSYRLLIEVMSVEPDKVGYYRLNAARQHLGAPILSRLPPFLTNFVLESGRA